MESGLNTKMQFADALHELMLSRPIEKISVTDIAEKAGISRKSFYNHFQDKYDLINWIAYTQFVQIKTDTLENGGWTAFRAFLEFFATDRVFFANALQDMGQNSFGQYFSDLLFEIVYAATYQGFARKGIDDKWIGLSVAALTEDARLAIIIWLTDNEKPDVDELFRFLVDASDAFASMICFERVLRTDEPLCDHAIENLTENWTYEPDKESFALPTPDDFSRKRQEFERLFSKFRRATPPSTD